MNLNDFRCMRNGLSVSTLSLQDSALINSIFIKNNEHKQRALLLFHGFSSSPAVFRQLLPSLLNYDCIISPLLPGHGTSLAEFSQIKAQDWIDAAEKICRNLIQEFEQLDILGLSLGGILACHLSTLFPLHHLYLLAPALNLTLKLEPQLCLAKLLNQLHFSEIRSFAGNLHQATFCEIAYRKLPIKTVIEMLTLIKEFKFSPPPCTTDLFLGCHDKVVASWQVAKRFAEHPHINIHWLSDSAHLLPLDSDRGAIIRCINNN